MLRFFGVAFFCGTGTTFFCTCTAAFGLSVNFWPFVRSHLPRLLLPFAAALLRRLGERWLLAKAVHGRAQGGSEELRY